VAAHRGESAGDAGGAAAAERYGGGGGRRSAARAGEGSEFGARIGFGREDACSGMGSSCGKVKLISVGPTKLTQIPPLRGGRIFGGVSPN
jgi:hypothetical protein